MRRPSLSKKYVRFWAKEVSLMSFKMVSIVLCVLVPIFGVLVVAYGEQTNPATNCAPSSLRSSSAPD